MEKKTILFETVIIIFAVIILFSLPILSLYSDKLEDGDHVSNTLAPILSFVGSILVYVAFKAQITANKKIQEQFEKQNFDQNFFRLIENAEKRLNNAEIERFDSDLKVRGYAILEYIIEEINKKHDTNAPIFGKYILINYPESLSDELWEKFFNEIDGEKYENMEDLKTKFLSSDKENREKIISQDIVEYEDYGNGIHRLKIDIFTETFYNQNQEFFFTYYNHILKKFFNKYIIFFDAYFKTFSMILKHIDSIEDADFYINYFNDNLTTYEKVIVWMAVATNKFSPESRKRIIKFEILSALNGAKGIKALSTPHYYKHIMAKLSEK